MSLYFAAYNEIRGLPSVSGSTTGYQSIYGAHGINYLDQLNVKQELDTPHIVSNPNSSSGTTSKQERGSVVV